MLSGCGGESSHKDATQEPTKLSFLTFNTALIAQTENLEQRLSATINDIPNTGADVICLQELWEPKHLKEVASKLRDAYPYAHWSVSEGQEVAGCNAADTDALLGCLTDACSDIESTEMTQCAVANCANAFTQVSTSCQNCVINHQTLPPQQIAASCELSDENSTEYKDQSGILLISKYPLKSKDYLSLESSFGDRGVLAATIESEFVSSADVYCTHLVATQSDIKYPGTYDSWNGERAVQIDALTQYIEEQRDDSESVVVMGDLNCGPDGGGVEGEDSEGFARLIKSGLGADYVKNKDFECTFCADNSLVSSSSPSVMIDHILFSNLPKDLTQESRRVFTNPTTIEVDGKDVKTAYSDHYGFQMTLTSKNP
jgi:endonuclease/exonuclease/phosphatase family metal-dependent hydrolase